VIATGAGQLTMNVASLTAWPSHLKQSKLNRVVTLTLPTDPTVGSASYWPGEPLVAWTAPTLGTLQALSGAPGALVIDRAIP
jgi:hypothetical protein